ncbi:hypothetical protein GCM10023220_22480 [Streptomyces ziwulingensis]|uniref:Integrase n=1 Tax=Streptomyces ziwulingensis TaxID=1045501 RepID=A0ABP9BHW9_9ACTN
MSGSTPAVSMVPTSRRRARGTLAASRRRWSDHQMLMLHQPPGRGSTYRYVLPDAASRKRGADVTPPIRRMRPWCDRCMKGRSVPKGDLPVVRNLVDLPYGAGGASAMMSPP